jgi:hypothetical protein
MHGSLRDTPLKKAVWERLDKLGFTNKVIDYIEKETKQVMDQGYEVYPIDVIERSIHAGLEGGGVKQDTEFNSGEVIALAYLFGVLLAHGILKNEAVSALSTTGS